MNKAIQEDLEVARLEVDFVTTTKYLTTNQSLLQTLHEILRRRRNSARAPSITETGTSLPPCSAPERESIGQPRASSWEFISQVDLETVLREPVRTIREPPRWFRGSLRQAYSMALRIRGNRPAASWKLFILTSRMLLGPTEERGNADKQVFLDRMRRFQRGDWQSLLEEARLRDVWKEHHIGNEEEERAKVLRQAERKVRLREASRARTLLSPSGLAPGNADTLTKLQSRVQNDGVPDIPPEIRHHRPNSVIKVDRSVLLQALRNAGRGSAQD